MKKYWVILLGLIASGLSWGWGNTGHRIVAAVAEQKLSPQGKKLVRQLLADESLVLASTWPDDIKSDQQWDHAYTWHYVTIEDDKNYQRAPKNPKGDIVEAIERMKKSVANKKQPLKKRREALRFLVHFVGDIHQPLHVGRKKDIGGNAIELKWFGKKSNLHRIWDTDMLELENLSYSGWVKLHHRPSQVEERWMEQLKTLRWVNESQKLRSSVYNYPKKRKKYWEYRYFYQQKETLNRRLLQAGYRLAGLINYLASSTK